MAAVVGARGAVVHASLNALEQAGVPLSAAQVRAMMHAMIE